jgi:L-alanine-DL-glutamate epimerase-like enolase superfamily enzyme
MKIKKIKVYKIGLPLKESSYKWSHNNEIKEFDNTIVKLETDSNFSGIGEVCTLGSSYLPAYARGVRSGIKEIGESLIGLDPTDIMSINNIMDINLKGHPYVKSPIDMACWDLMGKFFNVPVWKILGGKFGKYIDLYRAISQEDPSTMVQKVKKYKEEGYTKFQLKVGGNPSDDIERIIQVRSILEPSDILVADANTGWFMHDALRVINKTKHLDIYYEQPCASYEECLQIRQKTNNPFILDENIDSIPNFLQAYNDKAMDVINIKISKLGGLTKSKLLRDLCVECRVPMTIEDSWGGDISTSAIAHLAHSTPIKYRFSSTDFNSYNSISYTNGSPQRINGKMEASDNIGLGVSIHESLMENPLFTIG